MIPYARYLFESPSPRWNHRLIEHTGNDVPDFPAVWFPPNAPQYAVGVKSINIKEIQDNAQYTHALLKGDIMCAGLNISKRYSGYGNFGDYALLAEIGKNSFNGIRYISLLNIWFFKGMRQQSEILFDKWISGELILKDNLLPRNQGLINLQGITKHWKHNGRKSSQYQHLKGQISYGLNTRLSGGGGYRQSSREI